MSVTWLSTILLILASFRLTRLICFDKITQFIRNPFLEEVIVEENGVTETYWKIKGTKGFRKFMGELLSCYWCTGVWCSIFLTLGFLAFGFVMQVIVIILAVAGGASIVETIISRYLD